MYLYHRAPEEMKGNSIKPLNDLKKEHPELANKYFLKYNGREQVTKQKVPPLNCEWNDVVFLSAVDPEVVYSEYEKWLGKKVGERVFYKIKIDDLDEDKLIIYRVDKLKVGMSEGEREKLWEKFDKEEYEKLSKFPPEQILAWQKKSRIGFTCSSVECYTTLYV